LIRNENNVLLNILQEVEAAAVTLDDGWREIEIRFLNGDISGSHNTCLFRAHFAPGAAHERHYHPNADEFFYLIRGMAGVGAEDEEHVARAGTVQFIPAGKIHWLRNLDEHEPVDVIGVYVGGASLDEAGYEYVGEITAEYRQADSS
jgi:quercetin dioxygenase-like cupin family protein